MEHLQLHDAVIFLAAAGIVIPVVKRLQISPVLGFLLIGIAIGPYGLARWAHDFDWLSYVLISDIDGVGALAELGVVFLLFMIGLELSLERLWAMRRLVFGMGFSQIVVTGLVIGAIAYGFGNTVEASVLLGACLALSSTAIVIQLLIEQGRFGTTVGRGSFAILLAQDIAVVPILFMIGIFGTHSGDSIGFELALALGEALLAVLLILGIGRLIVRPLLRFVGTADSPELFMAVTLLIIIATAIATEAAGLSAALGAFLAGLLLAESEYRHEIEVNVEPFKGLLLGLFFMSVGMTIDVAQILADPVWIPLSVVGLFVIKALVLAVIARLYRYKWSHAWEMGLSLGQGGEFAFVVVALALSFELLPMNTAQFILIVVGASMFMTPFVTRMAHLLSERFNDDHERSDQPDVDAELKDHVVIVGFGRTGKVLATVLEQQQVPYVALDMDVARVNTLRPQGVPIFVGDASRASTLQKVQLHSAAALAICTDDPGATELVVQTAQRESPHTPVVARARDTEHARDLLSLGAERVVPELLESGLQLGHLMLEEIGYPPAAARELIEVQRIEMENRVLADTSKS